MSVCVYVSAHVHGVFEINAVNDRLLKKQTFIFFLLLQLYYLLLYEAGLNLYGHVRKIFKI